MNPHFKWILAKFGLNLFIFQTDYNELRWNTFRIRKSNILISENLNCFLCVYYGWYEYWCLPSCYQHRHDFLETIDKRRRGISGAHGWTVCDFQFMGIFIQMIRVIAEPIELFIFRADTLLAQVLVSLLQQANWALEPCDTANVNIDCLSLFFTKHRKKDAQTNTKTNSKKNNVRLFFPLALILFQDARCFIGFYKRFITTSFSQFFWLTPIKTFNTFVHFFFFFLLTTDWYFRYA